MATGIAAVLLAVSGFVGLGLLHDDPKNPDLRAPTFGSDPSTSAVALFPGSTPSSVGGRHLNRPTLSPEDAEDSAFVSAPVEVEPPLTDAPTIGDTPTCSDTVELTVIEMQGCPVASLIGTVVSATQEAVGLPEQDDRFSSITN